MARLPELILGTSGAIVELRLKTVRKSAYRKEDLERLAEQSAYMRRHKAPFVKVLVERGDSSYIMERARSLQADAPLAALLTQARASLCPLWDRPAALSADWAAAHLSYVRSLVDLHDLPVLGKWLLGVFERMGPKSLTVCCTHGDATLDNALRNEYDEIVWVDPIPYNDRIPPLLGVDLGKLLQSADGYEHIKYGGVSWQTPVGTEYAAVLDGISEGDVLAARYFRAVAYLRGLRYFTGPVLAHAFKELQKCTTSSI